MAIHIPKSESEAQRILRNYMMARGWLVEKSHGNEYQKGWPDLVAFHKLYGTRWIEMKLNHKSRLTPAQIKTFGIWHRHGARIYILTGYQDYHKLWEPPNWVWWLEHSI